MNDQIKQLEKEHARLEREIQALEHSGKFTDNQMKELKKQKLNVKDHLVRLRKQEYEDREYVEFDDDR